MLWLSAVNVVIVIEVLSFFVYLQWLRIKVKKTRELSVRRWREWLAAIRRQDIKPSNYPHTCVCSDHFFTGRPNTLYDSTHPDWIPLKSLGHDDCCISSSSGTSSSGAAQIAAASERYARAVNRAAAKQIRLEQDAVSTEEDELQANGGDVHASAELETGKAVQTTLTSVAWGRLCCS